ncbi:hypothetical protein K503DRAFT_122198 [Rhizopogon vinicolor AM-OR11-026]|uniref:Uncharacterized protein n=1 Tax=Rhizopogon vinicolor AM-OR11-026 TaxID=1314800 RepID=A0A1B7N260_9AGAM|nr:hypothetical protein K503DRAFT_122198 [Rhizopogon vinicolor AM-OR11-026]
MHIFYSLVAEATPEASAPPLLWESPTLASVKQLAARENSIWCFGRLKVCIPSFLQPFCTCRTSRSLPSVVGYTRCPSAELALLPSSSKISYTSHLDTYILTCTLVHDVSDISCNYLVLSILRGV